MMYYYKTADYLKDYKYNGKDEFILNKWYYCKSNKEFDWLIKISEKEYNDAYKLKILE